MRSQVPHNSSRHIIGRRLTKRKVEVKDWGKGKGSSIRRLNKLLVRR